jgi:peptide/nickel transport system substrate-binding protein
VKWKKVVIKIVQDENATLAAFRSGEVDYGLGDASTAKAAKSAGLQVLSTPYSVMQLQIMDREGKLVKALGDLRVRQAMMYAINRSAIASSLFGTYAKASTSTLLPGTSGYSAALSAGYDYNVAKAKQLLTEAGYPKGFTLPITVNLTGVGESKAAEAFAAEMSNIGINVKINVPANVNELFSTYTKYPAMMFDYGSSVLPPFASGNDFVFSWGNPLKVMDTKLDSLYAQAAGAPTAAAQEEGWQAFESRLSSLTWNIPMFSVDKIVYARPGLAGVNLSETNSNPLLTGLYAAK